MIKNLVAEIENSSPAIENSSPAKKTWFQTAKSWFGNNPYLTTAAVGSIGVFLCMLCAPSYTIDRMHVELPSNIFPTDSNGFPTLGLSKDSKKLERVTRMRQNAVDISNSNALKSWTKTFNAEKERQINEVTGTIEEQTRRTKEIGNFFRNQVDMLHLFSRNGEVYEGMKQLPQLPDVNSPEMIEAIKASADLDRKRDEEIKSLTGCIEDQRIEAAWIERKNVEGKAEVVQNLMVSDLCLKTGLDWKGNRCKPMEVDRIFESLYVQSMCPKYPLSSLCAPNSSNVTTAPTFSA